MHRGLFMAFIAAAGVLRNCFRSPAVVCRGLVIYGGGVRAGKSPNDAYTMPSLS
jgi:hypothetical protein